jgi:hypothetical protein
MISDLSSMITFNKMHLLNTCRKRREEITQEVPSLPPPPTHHTFPIQTAITTIETEIIEAAVEIGTIEEEEENAMMTEVVGTEVEVAIEEEEEEAEEIMEGDDS